jgi:transposase-like protein
MANSQSPPDATRPTVCPFCKGKIIDTLAKVISPTTMWRCRECDQTWTLQSQKAASTRRA